MSNPRLTRTIIFIVGPTAVGKTELGLKLARLLPSELISADSMQIYRGMDIITDKLPRAIRTEYSCRLIDVIDPSKEFNTARFCELARAAIKKVTRGRKTPVILGGTGLYVNSLLYGIFEGGPKDEKVRLKLKREAQEEGLSSLYEKLKRFDPAAALKINAHDERRIIRALEVYLTTKKPISRLQADRTGLKDDHEVHLFGLRRDRQELYRRIEQRVDFMINSGLLDEVKTLIKKKLSPTACQCIGIKEMEGFFKGAYDLPEAIRRMKVNSRHFAKRQMTWFNKNKDIEWIDLKEGEDLSAVARKIADRVTSRPG